MARPKSLHNRAELIVDAADELFARYGYERTSIDDIAKHLGIGKGSIYLEFRTKEEILAFIIKRHTESIHALIKQKVADCQDQPLDTIRLILYETSLQVFDIVTRDIHTPSALLHTSFQMKSRFATFFTSKRSYIFELLVTAADLGQISPDKATDETALALLIATSGFFPPYINNYSEGDSRISRETLIRRMNLVLDLLMGGLTSGQKDR